MQPHLVGCPREAPGRGLFSLTLGSTPHVGRTCLPHAWSHAQRVCLSYSTIPIDMPNSSPTRDRTDEPASTSPHHVHQVLSVAALHQHSSSSHPPVAGFAVKKVSSPRRLSWSFPHHPYRSSCCDHLPSASCISKLAPSHTAPSKGHPTSPFCLM